MSSKYDDTIGSKTQRGTRAEMIIIHSEFAEMMDMAMDGDIKYTHAHNRNSEQLNKDI